MNLPQALLRAYRLTSAGGPAADLLDAGAEHTEEEDQARPGGKQHEFLRKVRCGFSFGDFGEAILSQFQVP